MANSDLMAVKMRIGRLKKNLAAIKRNPAFKKAAHSHHDSASRDVAELESELRQALAKLKTL